MSISAEASLRARWLADDDDVELSSLEVAILLGWSPTRVTRHRVAGQMGAIRADGRWTVKAGELRDRFAADLQARRATASDTDRWI